MSDREFVRIVSFAILWSIVCTLVFLFGRPNSWRVGTELHPAQAVAVTFWGVLTLCFMFHDWFARLDFVQALAYGGWVLGFLSAYFTCALLATVGASEFWDQIFDLNFHDLAPVFGFSIFPVVQNPDRWFPAGMAAGLALRYIGRINANERKRDARTVSEAVLP